MAPRKKQKRNKKIVNKKVSLSRKSSNRDQKNSMAEAHLWKEEKKGSDARKAPALLLAMLPMLPRVASLQMPVVSSLGAWC